MKKVYLLLGFLFVALGAVGAFLPILPTVPFLLLASWCFGRGSDRWSRWLRSTKLYKKHLQDYEKDRSMTRRAKLAITIPVSVMIIGTIVLVSSLHLRLFLGALLLVKYWYFIFRIKTVRANQHNEQHKNIKQCVD